MKLFTITAALAALATPVLANHKWKAEYHSDPIYTGGVCTEAREGQYGCSEFPHIFRTPLYSWR